jgi:hypothetical protein
MAEVSSREEQMLRADEIFCVYGPYVGKYGYFTAWKTPFHHNSALTF